VPYTHRQVFDKQVIDKQGIDQQVRSDNEILHKPTPHNVTDITKGIMSVSRHHPSVPPQSAFAASIGIRLLGRL
jgi:hypothetical protein